MSDAFADRLATFVYETKYESLPLSVVEDVQLRLIDGIGLGLLGSSETGSITRSLLPLVRSWHAPGECTAIGIARGLSAPAAAILNATSIHVDDFDDTHTETLIHPTSCIVPAALSLAEKERLNGEELITLLATGYEVAIRVGLGACPGAQMQAQGFHTTALAGAVASAAMTAKASGSTMAAIANALRLSTSLGSGLLESTRDGTLAKVIQPGWAVQAGMWASEAGRSGITGAEEAFEGLFGLFSAHGARPGNAKEALAGLGDEWESLHTEYKLYPVCHHLQGHIDSALEIREVASISDACQVQAVEADVCPEQIRMVCEPTERRTRPTTAYGAKFSLQYSVATALHYGRLDAAVMRSALRADAVQRLALATSFRPRSSPDFPKRMPGGLRIEMRDGTTYSRTFASPPGVHGRPVMGDEICAKFRNNVDGLIRPGVSERLLDGVLALDKRRPASSVGDLLAALAPTP